MVYGMCMEETPEQKQHLDSIVYSGVDALILGCIDKVGKITYREALTLNKETDISVNS
jgi:hypothetical protein